MPIIAAIFDAFGTTVEISRRRRPFRQLQRIGTEQGRRPRADDHHLLMTSNLSLEAAAEAFGIRVSAQQMIALQQDLEEELGSITLYPDTLDALQMLREEGVVIGICSNLAAPYGTRLRTLLREVDAFALSYELGVMKPHPGIYHDMCRQLAVSPGWDMTAMGERVVMIGDSMQCDQDGPRTVGISGYHLDRKRPGRISSLIQFAELVIADRRR